MYTDIKAIIKDTRKSLLIDIKDVLLKDGFIQSPKVKGKYCFTKGKDIQILFDFRNVHTNTIKFEFYGNWYFVKGKNIDDKTIEWYCSDELGWFYMFHWDFIKESFNICYSNSNWKKRIPKKQNKRKQKELINSQYPTQKNVFLF